MEKDFDIVIAGHICLDLIPKWDCAETDAFASLFKPGKLIQIGPATISTGGAVSNTGQALQRLGLKTVLMAKIGHDVMGETIRHILRSNGANDTGIKAVESDQSSYTVVLAPPGIDRIFLHCPGCNDTFSAEDISYDLCRRARFFHFGYPSLMRRLYANRGEALVEIFRQVRRNGSATSVDMSLPDPGSEAGQADWDAILRDLLPHVDFFMPSIEEALYMLMRDRYEALAAEGGGPDMIDRITGNDLTRLSDRILSHGAAVAAIKVSHRGIYLRTANANRMKQVASTHESFASEWADREIWQPSFRAPRVVSATGAGDTAIAGFLAALLRGHSPEGCLKTSCLVGWQNVQAADAISGIRTWSETENLLRCPPDRLPLQPQSTGWTQDSCGCWIGPNNR